MISPKNNLNFLSKIIVIIILFLVLGYKYSVKTYAQVCSGNVSSSGLCQCVKNTVPGSGEHCDYSFSQSSPCAGSSCSAVSYNADTCSDPTVTDAYGITTQTLVATIPR